MDTYSELAENAYYETLDAGKPTCSECGKTEREVSLVWCGARHCNNSICEECATAAQWQLEACSANCEVTVAMDMADREAKLRHQVYQLRKQAKRASASADARRRQIMKGQVA